MTATTGRQPTLRHGWPARHSRSQELGARAGAQVLAAGCTAVSAYVIAVGHLLSTSTFDLLAWIALSWLLARALHRGGPVWLAVGLVAGVGLENKTLLAFYLGALAVALLAVRPRTALHSPWLCSPWLCSGVVVALALWAPNLWWQATHGWPLWELSAAIVAGGSATSTPRWLFLPFQLVLVSPMLVPVWGIGLWRLLRDSALRMFRLFGVAYVLLGELFASVTPAAHIDNGVGLDTEEQGRTVWVCRDQRRPWPQIRHIG